MASVRRLTGVLWQRAWSSWQPIAVAALGAALAWLIAHRALGHSQPFFAPIAAAVALSSSPIQRGRRSVQLVAGVLLGIAVAELLQSAFGRSTVALGAIVFVTMIIAVAVGAGFFGQGMMFVNQAAASAILVITLHRSGIGAERALDAVVGGAVALVLGVLLFPAQPLRILAEAEGRVLSALARALRDALDSVQSGTAPSPRWAVETGHRIHRLLASMTDARSTARAIVRIAPLRWRLRRVVEAESDRTAWLDLLANAVLSLIRSSTREQIDEEQPVIAEPMRLLAEAIERLARAQRPWSPALLSEVRRACQAAAERTADVRAPVVAVVASILRAAVTDLERVVGVQPDLPD